MRLPISSNTAPTSVSWFLIVLEYSRFPLCPAPKVAVEQGGESSNGGLGHHFSGEAERSNWVVHDLVADGQDQVAKTRARARTGV